MWIVALPVVARRACLVEFESRAAGADGDGVARCGTPRNFRFSRRRSWRPKEEKTVPARYYVPYTDIYETDEALTLVMEVPGVEKKDVSVQLENDMLRVEGRIDFSKYEGLEPVYAEYNVGHYSRAFTLSDKTDQDGISAELADGVLTLTLKKAKAALPRRIAIH